MHERVIDGMKINTTNVRLRVRLEKKKGGGDGKDILSLARSLVCAADM